MMPACGPVNEIAGTPIAWSAIETSVALWCSPVASSMSSSRESGSSVTAAARARSSSVASPIAETTTTRRAPLPRSRAIRRATRRIRSASASDDPPYFWTTSPGSVTRAARGVPTSRVAGIRRILAARSGRSRTKPRQRRCRGSGSQLCRWSLSRTGPLLVAFLRVREVIRLIAEPLAGSLQGVVLGVVRALAPAGRNDADVVAGLGCPESAAGHEVEGRRRHLGHVLGCPVPVALHRVAHAGPGVVGGLTDGGNLVEGPPADRFGTAGYRIPGALEDALLRHVLNQILARAVVTHRRRSPCCDPRSPRRGRDRTVALQRLADVSLGFRRTPSIERA